MSDSFEDARKLVITGGAIIMFLLLIGLSKIGVDTETLFYFLPMVWLAGIILCGMMMQLCNWVNILVSYTPPSSRNASFAGTRSADRDADLATAEFIAFTLPRGDAASSLSSGRTMLLSRKSSLPKYEELTHATQTRVEIEPEHNADDGEHLLPPTYEEAVSRCPVVEREARSAAE